MIFRVTIGDDSGEDYTPYLYVGQIGYGLF